MALAVMEERRTIRQYEKDYVIPKDVLEKIANAGLHAPTAVNYQEHDLLFITDKAKLDKIGDVAMKEWPENYRKMFESRKAELGVANVVTCDASCVVFLVKNERYNDLFGQIDAGIVLMAMMVAAKDLGLDTMCLGCFLWGAEPVEQVIGIPKGSMGMALAIGKKRADAKVGEKKLLAKATYQ